MAVEVVEVDLEAGALKTLKDGLQVLVMHFTGVSVDCDVIQVDLHSRQILQDCLHHFLESRWC